MFGDDHRVGQAQALAGAFTDVFGGEEGVEHAAAGLVVHAWSVIGDGDEQVLGVSPGGDRDGAQSALVAAVAVFADGLGGVDDHVEDDLFEFALEAGGVPGVGGQVEVKVGDVLPFVPADLNGGFDRAVDVDVGAAAAGMGVVLHRPDDLGGPGKALAAFGEGSGDLHGQEAQVDRFQQRPDLVPYRPFRAGLGVSVGHPVSGVGGVGDGGDASGGLQQAGGDLGDELG